MGIVFIIIWILSGLIADILALIFILRGLPYDPNYFDGEMVCILIVMFISGYVGLLSALVIAAYMVFTEKYEVFIERHPEYSITKIIYKIANIGLDTESEERDNNETDI